jgi:hypothetical protein
LPDSARSLNLLFGEVVLVLVFDSQLRQVVHFFLLDLLDLKSFVFETLADLAAFLEVVEAFLLLVLLVLDNLFPNLN